MSRINYILSNHIFRADGNCRKKENMKECVWGSILSLSKRNALAIISHLVLKLWKCDTYYYNALSSIILAQPKKREITITLDCQSFDTLFSAGLVIGKILMTLLFLRWSSYPANIANHIRQTQEKNFFLIASGYKSEK